MISHVLSDSFGRILRDLRVSVTDRCNFRCVYCLPETDQAADFYRSKFDAVKNPSPIKIPLPPSKPRSQILTFEEIERVVKIGVELGIEKIRLTGGEPLLRQNIEVLVGKISQIPSVKDLAMTSNGFLFHRKAQALKDAGLTRMSFSLDSLDADNFKKMTGRDGFNEVIRSIRLAKSLGMDPVKVNAVVIRGLNEHELGDLVRFAISEGVQMRFIEFMPLDSNRGWLRDLVVSGKEMLTRLKTEFELEPVSGSLPSETAKRWRVNGTSAEIGIIAPVTEPFCGHCNRLRLTADGKIRTCLFSLIEHDLKGMMRRGADDEQLRTRLREIAWLKEARHHIGEAEFKQPERTMSCIGG